MHSQNIICFAKDWDEDPTCNNHVMRLLARDNRVLWLNSVATRSPDFTRAREWRKIGRKLASIFHGLQQVDAHLWVYTPFVLPFPHSPTALALNRRILRTTVSVLRRHLRMDEFQLWSFIPTAGEYFGTLGESLAVYYCTDEWSRFAFVDGRRIEAAERALCRKADLVFTTARALLERKKAYNPQTYLASHGVDHTHFATALDDRTPVPAEVRALPRPIIGFFGWIEGWIDLDLLSYVAERRPQWSIVLIGKVTVDVSALKRHRNVHLLGRKPYRDLPGYCRAFDVGICPFVLNELTRHVNPVKLYEYLSAGLPVVATNIPEVARCSEWCEVANDAEGFLAACEAAIKGDSQERRRRRSEVMRGETWQIKVSELGERVMEVQRQKRASRPATGVFEPSWLLASRPGHGRAPARRTPEPGPSE